VPRIAHDVLVLGAIALGFALAFGLGGRDVADRMLRTAYASGQEAIPRLKVEMARATQHGADEVERLKDRLPDEPETANAPTPGQVSPSGPPRPRTII
jgi:hypothetical protein